VLPTDGYRGTSPGRQALLDQDERGLDGAAARRPGPTMAQPPASPGVGTIGSAQPPQAPAPARRREAQQAATRPEQVSASPGFSF